MLLCTFSLRGRHDDVVEAHAARLDFGRGGFSNQGVTTICDFLLISQVVHRLNCAPHGRLGGMFVNAAIALAPLHTLQGLFYQDFFLSKLLLEESQFQRKLAFFRKDGLVARF